MFKNLNIVQVFFLFAAIGIVLSMATWAVMIHVFGFETAVILRLLFRT